jgi:hypothetical protein
MTLMTEAEWLACIDPQAMLDSLNGKADDRKLRLFSCACCRRAWGLMADARHRKAVEAAERFSDGLTSEAEFAEAMQPVADLWGDIPSHQDNHWGPSEYLLAATRHVETGGGAPWAAGFAAGALACLAGADGDPSWFAARRAEEAIQCELLRDVIGDPSRPFHLAPAWLSGEGIAAVELARAIYEVGHFERLPELAEALEKAGCRDRAVLHHCQEPGRHVRGCWVLDALLGRESAVRTGLLTERDWRACNDPEPLLHYLQNKGSKRKWRLFAVACCRRIDHLIADERSRRAVEVAARYVEGAATEEELEAARAAAQEALGEAAVAEYEAEAEANFALTPTYAEARCRSYGARAARGVVSRDVRITDYKPDDFEARYWRSIHAWAEAAIGNHTYAGYANAPVDSRWEEGQAAADVAREVEQRIYCDLLRDPFGEYFGPPGGDGDWLPRGPRTPRPMQKFQQWCLLPTPLKPFIRPEWLAWNGCVVRHLAQAIYEEKAFDRLPILADALEEAGCDNTDVLAHCRSGGQHVRGCWVVDLLLGKE